MSDDTHVALPTPSTAAIEAASSVIRNGQPHDGSDLDYAVDDDMRRALTAALPHLIDDAMHRRVVDSLSGGTVWENELGEQLHVEEIAHKVLRAALGEPPCRP